MSQGDTESGRFGPDIELGQGGSTVIEWVWFGVSSE